MGGKIGKAIITENIPEWDREPRFQGRSARDKGLGLPYMEDIFKVNFASVLQHWSPRAPSQSMLSPPRPLSINVAGARFEKIRIRGSTQNWSELIFESRQASAKVMSQFC